MVLGKWSCDPWAWHSSVVQWFSPWNFHSEWGVSEWYCKWYSLVGLICAAMWLLGLYKTEIHCLSVFKTWFSLIDTTVNPTAFSISMKWKGYTSTERHGKTHACNITEMQRFNLMTSTGKLRYVILIVELGSISIKFSATLLPMRLWEKTPFALENNNESVLTRATLIFLHIFGRVYVSGGMPWHNVMCQAVTYGQPRQVISIVADVWPIQVVLVSNLLRHVPLASFFFILPKQT